MKQEPLPDDFIEQIDHLEAYRGDEAREDIVGIISIRGPAAGVVAGIFREKLLEEKEAKRVKKRGPKTKVMRAERKKGPQQPWWRCQLECGHAVERPIKKRRVGPGHDPVDHAPYWVYCELCSDDEYTGRHEHA